MQADTAAAGPLGDAALITAVRAGDIEAFVALVGRHQRSMRRLATLLDPLGLTGDLADDALAVACTSLVRGYGPALALRPYLLMLVGHLYQVRAAGLGSFFPGDEGVFTARPFADHASGHGPHPEMVAAVAGLPEAWQGVLWHLGVEQDSPDTVGRLLGVPAASVGGIVARARAAVAGDGPAPAVAEIGRALAAHLLGGLAAEYLTLASATAPRRDGRIPAPR
ncbi:MAG: RNA polymerase sigma factor, partial [Nocardioidaceae bacterium]